MKAIEDKTQVKVYLPVITWAITLVMVERWVPMMGAIAGVIAGTWVYPDRVTLGMAFFAGLLIDITWARPLGVTSLGLVVMALIIRLIHDQLTQWWLLGILALVSGLVASWWLWGKFNWWLIFIAPILTYLWWFIMWRSLPDGKGVYLQR